MWKRLIFLQIIVLKSRLLKPTSHIYICIRFEIGGVGNKHQIYYMKRIKMEEEDTYENV